MLDLNGWLVVENVLSSEEVAALNASLDANWDRRSRGFESEKRKAFDQMHGMLEWPTADAQPFRELLAHPKVVPYLNTILGRGWRMDHSPFLLSSTAGFEGQVGGGMSVHGSTAIQHHGGSYYHYANGQMRSGMLVCAFQLTDMAEGDGGFGVVRIRLLSRPFAVTLPRRKSFYSLGKSSIPEKLTLPGKATRAGKAHPPLAFGCR